VPVPAVALKSGESARRAERGCNRRAGDPDLRHGGRHPASNALALGRHYLGLPADPRWSLVSRLLTASAFHLITAPERPRERPPKRPQTPTVNHRVDTPKPTISARAVTPPQSFLYLLSAPVRASLRPSAAPT
jgi:hypothetical protein